MQDSPSLKSSERHLGSPPVSTKRLLGAGPHSVVSKETSGWA